MVNGHDGVWIGVFTIWGTGLRSVAMKLHQVSIRFAQSARDVISYGVVAVAARNVMIPAGFAQESSLMVASARWVPVSLYSMDSRRLSLLPTSQPIGLTEPALRQPQISPPLAILYLYYPVHVAVGSLSLTKDLV